MSTRSTPGTRRLGPGNPLSWPSSRHPARGRSYPLQAVPSRGAEGGLLKSCPSQSRLFILFLFLYLRKVPSTFGLDAFVQMLGDPLG